MMRSVLVLIALLVGTIPSWAERGHEDERSLPGDTGTRQKPAQSGPAPRVEAWWKTVGDPAVYAFRDCAIVRITIDPDATSPGYLAGREVFRACADEFDHLHGVLVSAYSDDEKAKAAFDQIAQSTILPALDDAIRRKRAAEAGESPPQDERSWAALNRLYDCGADASRNLASATSDSAQSIAAAALDQCAASLTDYLDLGATTAAQKQDLKRNVVAKFKPFVIRQVTDMRASAQPAKLDDGPGAGSVTTGQ